MQPVHLLWVSLFDRAFWLQKIVLQLGALGFYDTNPLELFGLATALACVYLTVRQHIWCWPIGIVSALAYAFFFREIKLYADAWLQIFFVGTSFYGWHWWLHGGPERSQGRVSRLSPRQLAGWTLATIVAVATVGVYHATLTDADLPYLDALASGGSVTAQLLMMRKKSECWPLWIAVDVLSVGIYAYKQVFFTAALYAAFLVLAALGWHQWMQESRSQTPRPNLDSNLDSSAA